MSKFSDEIARATAALERLAASADRAGRGLGGGGGAGGGGSAGVAGAGGFSLGPTTALGAIGAGVGLSASLLGGAISAGASFLTPAAQAYAMTGTSQGLQSAVTQSLLGAAGSTSVGGFLTGLLGLSAAQQTNQSAGSRVSQLTESIARVTGQPVSDELRSTLFGIAQRQEKAVTEERAKVDALAGSADALRGGKPVGASGDFDKAVDVLKRIERNTKEAADNASWIVRFWRQRLGGFLGQ